MTMPDDSRRDLLAAYAVDAVDADERAMIDNLLASDVGMRAELAEHHELLAVLAQAVEVAPSTPSPAVWDGIRSAISGTAETQEAPEFTPVREARRRRFATRMLGLVAAVALVAATALGVRVATFDDTNLVAAADALRSDSQSRVVTLTDTGGLAVEIVLGADGVGYIYTDSLPEIAADRTYQLWAINDNGVISAGIFGRDGVAPFHIDGEVAGLAITEEVAGGVVASENDPVAVWLNA